MYMYMRSAYRKKWQNVCHICRLLPKTKHARLCMYVYVCVCVCVCVHVYMYVCMHACIYDTHMHTHGVTYMHRCVYT